MKEAELLFTPGCKAGSDKCEGCELLELDYMHTLGCYFGEHQKHFNGKVIDAGKFKRLSACLEAESQSKELREKVEKAISFISGQKYNQEIIDDVSKVLNEILK